MDASHTSARCPDVLSVQGLLFFGPSSPDIHQQAGWKETSVVSVEKFALGSIIIGVEILMVD